MCPIIVSVTASMCYVTNHPGADGFKQHTDSFSGVCELVAGWRLVLLIWASQLMAMVLWQAPQTSHRGGRMDKVNNRGRSQ